MGWAGAFKLSHPSGIERPSQGGRVIVNSNQISARLSRSKFMQFRMNRRKELLEKRNANELKFEQILKSASITLSDKYRFHVIPQKSRFLPRYGLVYGDFLIRSICLKTNYGRKIWVEIDGAYHDDPIQKRKDSWRQKCIVKKYKKNLLFLRFKTHELSEPTFLEKLLKLLDWQVPVYG